MYLNIPFNILYFEVYAWSYSDWCFLLAKPWLMLAEASINQEINPINLASFSIFTDWHSDIHQYSWQNWNMSLKETSVNDLLWQTKV